MMIGAGQGAKNSGKIEHFVVLLMENRPFDQLFVLSHPSTPPQEPH